ncbi:MAG: 3'-5' exonuclease [Candidatus Bathyarchaeia archaeon]
MTGQYRWLPSLRDLDEEQQNVIHNSLSKGRNLIYGPAGCGKTAILLYCAKTLQDLGKEYAVFVYTKVLYGFIKSALDDLEIPGTRVHRFYQWVYNLLKKYSLPIDESEERYSIWVDILLRYFHEHPQKIPKFDFILVDEAQDFRENASKLLQMMSNNLFIAGDAAQSIYSSISSHDELVRLWAPIQNSYTLVKNYRNPKTVARLASLFLDPNSMEAEEFLRLVKGRDYEMKPVWFSVNNINQQSQKIAEIVMQTRGAERIGILCRRKSNATNLASILTNQYKIKVQLAQNDNSDCQFNSAWPVITTIHSAKGLEFDCVIIPYLDTHFWGNGDFHYSNERRLFFVAITRTKNRLFLISTEGNECFLIKEILDKDPSLVQKPSSQSIHQKDKTLFIDDDPF